MRVPFEWLIIASIFMGQLAYAQGESPAYYGGGMPAGGDAYQFYPAPGYGPPDPGALYAELLPADRALTYPEDFGSRSAITTKEMFRGTWLRLEYLQGNFSHEGGRVLGEPIVVTSVVDPTVTVSIPDPSQQFSVFNTTGDFVGLAEVPTSFNIRWRNAQGIRGSFGIPVAKAFSIEGRLWQYEDQEASLNTPRFPPLSTSGIIGTVNSTFLATSLTTDGIPSGEVILYDAGFSSSYTSSMKAGDVALVFNWKNPDQGWRMQPILGYRHEEYSEGLGFGGSFDNRSNFLDGAGIIPTESNWIQSNASNQREMMEVGMRTEWQKGNLTFGVQERIAFGSNIAKTAVHTSNLREPGSIPGTIDDPEWTTSTERRTTFAPSFDLDVYANLQVNRWLSLRVGYNLIWLGGIAAADQSIRFNQISDGMGGTLPDVGSNLNYSNRTVSALTIGGEIILP